VGAGRSALEGTIIDSVKRRFDFDILGRTFLHMTIEPIKEKLDDKIKKLNSSRVYKKVTPRGDLSWYVKWISVVLILIATAARSVGTIPHIDMWFGFFGTIGWAFVGYLWHDRALMFLNAVLVTLLAMGLMNYYFGI
jgi:hypothetical protein